MSFSDDSLALLIIVFGVVITSLKPRLQAWQLDFVQAHSSADFVEIVAKVLVADNKVNAKLTIDKVEAVIGLPIAFHELGENLSRLSKLVEGYSKPMIEAFVWFERRVVSALPSK